jgi:peroxiredoxin
MGAQIVARLPFVVAHPARSMALSAPRIAPFFHVFCQLDLYVLYCHLTHTAPAAGGPLPRGYAVSDVLQLYQPAPDFELPSDSGEVVCLHRVLAQSPVLLFFYPGDFTPVCTREVCDFRDDYHHFQRRGITILGVSSDPVDRHRRFAEQCRVPFRLLSDENLVVSRAYGARGLLGMRRAYYLIDRDRTLLWQHAETLPIFRMSNRAILDVIDSVLGPGAASSPNTSKASNF